MKEKFVDPRSYKLSTNLRKVKILSNNRDPRTIVPDRFKLEPTLSNGEKLQQETDTRTSADHDLIPLKGAEPSPKQQTAAALKVGMDQITIAKQIADEYVEKVYANQSRKRKRHIRKQVSRFVAALLEGEQTGSIKQYGEVTNSPELISFKAKIDQINNVLVRENIEQANLLSTKDRMKIVGDLVGQISSGKYSPDQIMHLLDTAGITPEERKRLLKTVVMSTPIMVGGNFILGTASEAFAASIGYVYHNEIVRNMNALDPETRNTIAIALPVITQSAVYALTYWKNYLSKKFYRQGSNIVLDPNMVVDEALTNKVMDPKEYNFLRNVMAHFSNPANWSDEKWYFMLLANDYGVTFSIGNAAASAIKGVLIGVGEGALYYKKRYEAKHQKELNLNLKVIDQFFQWASNRRVTKKMMKKFFNNFAAEPPDIDLLQDFLKDYSNMQDAIPTDEDKQLTVSEGKKPVLTKRNIFTRTRMTTGAAD